MQRATTDGKRGPSTSSLSVDLLVLIASAVALELLLTTLALPAALAQPVGFVHLALDVTRYWAFIAIPLALLAVAWTWGLRLFSPQSGRLASPVKLLGWLLGALLATSLVFVLRAVPNRGHIEFPALLHTYDAFCLLFAFVLFSLIVRFFSLRVTRLEELLPILFHRATFEWLVPLLAVSTGVVLSHLVAAPVYQHGIALLFSAAGLAVALSVRAGLSRCETNRKARVVQIGLAILILSLPLSGNAHSRFVLHGHVAGAGAVATYWRSFTDFDGDGATASYLGGNDCAPRDPTISPLHKEIAGDGINQDCVGGDAEKNISVPAPVLLPECASETPRDILLITVDALRPDAISGTTMPYLHHLKAQAQRFTQAYPPSGSTAGTVLGMLLGKSLSDLNPHSLYLSEKLELDKTITTRLKEAGYRTAVLFPFNISPFVRQGADLATIPFADLVPSAPKGGKRAGIMSKTALDFLLSPHSDKPAFLWMHIPDLHAPYWVLDEESALSPYEQAASSVDHLLGILFEQLRRSGHLKNTLVVLSSDHGEQVGQRGREGHGTLFFEEGIRVPLLVLAPGCEKKTQNAPANLSALPDLFLRYAAKRPARERPEGEPFPVVVEEAQLTALGLKRAFIGKRYKMIFDLLNGGEIAFDLKLDPEETEPLPLDSPEVNALRVQYQRWLDSPGNR